MCYHFLKTISLAIGPPFRDHLEQGYGKCPGAARVPQHISPVDERLKHKEGKNLAEVCVQAPPVNFEEGLHLAWFYKAK
jgi:hypothetical protein